MPHVAHGSQSCKPARRLEGDKRGRGNLSQPPRFSRKHLPVLESMEQPVDFHGNINAYDLHEGQL